MNTPYKRYAAGLAVAATITSLAMTLPAFADTNINVGANISAQAQTRGMHEGAWQGRGPDGKGAPGQMKDGRKPAVFGTVTVVNGATITVASRSFGKNAATTTYSVNAANATVFKNNATSSVSSIAINDQIMVMGTISGTTVTATSIRDGIPMMNRGRGPDQPDNGGTGQSLPLKGNGEPVVAGSVSSVNGNAITITTSSNTSYTIDAASSTVNKAGATSTVSAISVGDYVVVQGTVNGATVTASSILDAQVKTSAQGNSGNAPGHNKGLFGSIGGFFKHLFGF
jgi:hypothetical protein